MKVRIVKKSILSNRLIYSKIIYVDFKMDYVNAGLPNNLNEIVLLPYVPFKLVSPVTWHRLLR